VTSLLTGATAARASRPYVTGTRRGNWRVTPWHAGWLCIVSGLILSLLGVYAIDIGLRPDLNSGLPVPREVRSQALYLVVGLILAVAVALPNYRWARWTAWPLMALSLALLLFLHLPGVPTSIVKPVNGARSWINLGVFTLQPSEVAKIAFVLVVASYLRFRRSHRTVKGLIPLAIMALIPMALIMKQPDLGSATLFIPTLVAMLVAAGMRLKHLAVLTLCALLLAPASYPFLKPHQKVRIDGLIKQIQGDKTGAYDINYQSFTAQKLVGAGRITGNSDAHARALMEFNRLPERHNDMIFSAVCTRFGFFGGLSVILLYALWFLGAILAAAVCKDPFGRLLPIGFLGFTASQAIVNIGMNVGVLPIVGITLPFVSAGGSSMIILWIMNGLIVSVAMRRPRPPFRPSFEYDDDE
jgi:cell division protein FtsW (lipid II flippase)